MKNDISEKVIEDILVADKQILAGILNLKSQDMSLLARQKILESGILDLLYLWRDELLLIELKIVPFYNGVIQQINGYYQDLLQLQKENKLINANIRKIILATSAGSADYFNCNNSDIELFVYDTKSLLVQYYEHFREIAQFINIKSGDYGMVRLGLLNPTLQNINEGLSIEEVAKRENKSVKTIRNRLSVAEHLNLVGRFRNRIFLTEQGSLFVSANLMIDDRICLQQIELLQEFVKNNPFYSSITYTIISIVECVFILSKNSYPVPKELLKDYFIKSVGKTTTWVAEKSKETATYIFSNYAVELGLISKVDNEFFITPNGIQAVLLLQLNRSIKLIDSRKFT